MSKNLSKKRITVGLPVYNGEKYLKQTIESVLNQDFYDFDFIICDNCSTDSTENICKEFALKDKRIKYYRNEENVGAIKNSVIVLDKANTEFFVFLCHDDYFEKNFLRKCIEKLDKNPSAISCCTEINFIDANGNRLNNINSKGIDTSGLGTVARFKMLWSKAIWTATHAVYRTYFLKEVSPIQFKYGCDIILLTGVVLCGDIIRVNEKLFNYRVIKKSTEDYQELFFGSNSSFFSEKPVTELLMGVSEQIINLVNDSQVRDDLFEFLFEFLKTHDTSLKSIIKESEKESEKEINTAFIKELLITNSLQTKINDYDNNFLKEELKFLEIEKEEYLIELYKKKNYFLLKEELSIIEKEYHLTLELINIKSILLFYNQDFEKSFYLIKNIVRDLHKNYHFYNNFAIVNFYMLNISTALKILNKSISNEDFTYQVENYVKILDFLGSKNSIKTNLSMYFNSDKYILKYVLAKCKSFEIQKENCDMSIVILATRNSNLTKEQINNILAQKTKFYIEIFVVYDHQYNLNNFNSNITLIPFYSNKGETIYTSINKAISLARGKYLTVMTPEQFYFEGFFDKIISTFEMQSEDTMIIYTNIYNKIEGGVLEGVSISSIVISYIIEAVSYLGTSVFWKKEIHDFYGYLKENEYGIEAFTELSLYEFIVRVNQTHKVLFDNMFSGTFKLDSEKTNFYLKKALSFIVEYNEARLKNEILYYKKDMPKLEFYDINTISSIAEKRNFKYYIFYEDKIDFSFLENLKQFYIILFQKTELTDLSEKEINLINLNFDQVWVTNQKDRDLYIDLGIDKYRIIVVDLLDNFDKSLFNFRETISHLENKPIFRENITLIKKELLELAYKYFDEKDYTKSEELFYKLHKIDVNNSELIFYLALSLYYQENYDEAINYFAECLELDFYNKEIFEIMAKSLEKTGDTEMAEEYYQRAKELS